MDKQKAVSLLGEISRKEQELQRLRMVNVADMKPEDRVDLDVRYNLVRDELSDLRKRYNELIAP